MGENFNRFADLVLWIVQKYVWRLGSAQTRWGSCSVPPDSDSLATLIYAVVNFNSRMDYCNTVLAGAPRTVTDKLQRVLNAAAHFVWPDPTQLSADWPNPSQPTTSEKIWTQPDPNQYYSCYLITLSLYSFWSVSGTCQIGHKIKFNCLVQPNLI